MSFLKGHLNSEDTIISPQQPRCLTKPFCFSTPSGSTSRSWTVELGFRTSRTWKNWIFSWIWFAMPVTGLRILDGESISMTPSRHLPNYKVSVLGYKFKSVWKPFFIAIASSPTPRAPLDSVDLSSARTCRNSTGNWESPVTLSFWLNLGPCKSCRKWGVGGPPSSRQ